MIMVGQLGTMVMSDIKAITDYLRKYNAWRRGEDERTMDEAGIVPADLGQMIDAAVGSLERFPAMSRIALRKIEQMGGTPCGLLVRNEAGALAAVSDMGRVIWLDDYIMAPVARDEDVALPAQGDAEKEAEKEESKGDFPLKEESLIRKAARAQGDAEPEADDGKGRLPWFVEVYNKGYQAGHHDTVEGWFTDVHHSDIQTYHEDEVMELLEGLNVRVHQEGAPPMDQARVAELEAELAQAVPEGRKLVPIVPTKSMQDAWDTAPTNECADQEFIDAYQAMLDAAPQPPQEGLGDA